MEENPVKQFLESEGYILRSDKDGWRAKAIYRGGGNENSLFFTKNGHFTDFGAGISGSFQDFVKLIKGEVDDARIKELIAKAADIKIISKIKVKKTWPLSYLDTLVEKYDFYTEKGISVETLKEFRMGFSLGGEMANRYVFPIFSRDGQTIDGLHGRYYRQEHPHDKKWKKKGESKKHLYPLFLNENLIREKKEIIITESIGDLLAMFEMGKRNVITIFGVKMHAAVLNFLCSIELNKITIALNDDRLTNNNSVGNLAAEKLKKQLKNHFSEEKIQIVYPAGENDWSDYVKNKYKNKLNK